MADTIKIGSLDISAFKVGSSDCKIYLGDTLLYPQSPTPPTYQWLSYNEGDTVPSTTFYGVKLYGLDFDGEIDFSTDGHSGVAFVFDTSSGEWTAINLASYDPIDISEYFDYTEGCYIIYFSDLGYGGLPINYPVPSGSFEFDVQLYGEYVPTLQWVTFNNGDTIPSDLEIYGVSGLASNLARTFIMYGDNIYFSDEGRGKCAVHIGWMEYCYCYEEEGLSMSSNLEYIFSNISNSCKLDSYTVSNGVTVGGTIKLYIYA